jgi:hypothetical protein
LKEKMMKFLLLSALIISSCTSAPDGFCDCLEKGEKLNLISHEILEGKNSDSNIAKMKEMKALKKEACAPFQTASGKSMIDWQKACEKN